MLDPCCRGPYLPGKDKIEPRGVVARWMSSAGGGEEGRGGGPSLVDPLRLSLLSGMKLGGGMVVGGGGSLGGGGKDITGGRVLSTDVRIIAEAEGTRDLG